VGGSVDEDRKKTERERDGKRETRETMFPTAQPREKRMYYVSQ